jgi:hypothetical protein
VVAKARGYCYRHYKRWQTHGSAYHKVKERLIINVPKRCPVLGIKLMRGSKIHNGSPTIDRINNSKGYTKNNILIVSSLANRIKSNSTVKQLVAVANFYKELANA